MKTLLIAASSAWLAATAFAASTIDPAHPHAWGANIGWLDMQGDVANGTAVGQSYCAGYAWSANCGWICLGNGPTNGWRYSNASLADWGVNHDGQGRLSGYAWGANIGWINFEQTNGVPRVDLPTGNLSGHVWGENVGWISLNNAQAYVRTTTLSPGPDNDGDGIPDPWEYQTAEDTNTLFSGHDQDGDGAFDEEEYAADTDPMDGEDLLEIVSAQSLRGTNRTEWTVEPTRFYRLEQAAAATNGALWTDSGLGLMAPGPGATMARDAVDSTSRFYRVKAVVPLGQ